jgi:hypothetical protein
MWGRSAAVAAAVAVLACAVAAPGRAAAAGVRAAGDAGATDSAVPVAASFIAEGPDLFPVVCVMFSWPGHPQDRVGCVAHLGYVAQVLRTGHVDLCTPNQPMCRVEFNERPTTARYGPGKVVDVGPYRCEVLKVAVRCLVRSTGSGFRINNHEAVRVAAGPPKKSAAPHYHYFVSPDRVVWCSAEESGAGAGAFCDVGNFWNNGFHSGEVHPGGVVRVCNHTPAEGYCGALGGGNVPILQYGQSTELGGVRCVSATNGITCTITKGTDAGKGARVNKTEAVAVG